MPGNGGVNTDSRSDNESPGRNGKAKAVPVGLVSYRGIIVAATGQ